MNKLICTIGMFALGISIIFGSSVCLASEPATSEVAAALSLKLIPFEKNLGSAADNISIHVIGSPKIAEAFVKAEGTKIGKGTLLGVTISSELPTKKPSIIFLAEAGKQAEVVEYSKTNKVLCVTNLPELVAKGIALGIGLGADGKPEVFLNLAASKEAGLEWNPAILKIAKTTD